MTDTSPVKPEPRPSTPVPGKDWSAAFTGEVWLLILKECSYASLRALESQSKKLEGLTCARFPFAPSPLRRHPRVDPLPHSSDQEALYPFNELEIHPMLEHANCVFCTTKEASIYSFVRPQAFNACNYPAADEHATQPPAKEMYVRLPMGQPIGVSDRNRIKVRRVLKAIGKFWEKNSRERLGDRNGWAVWRGTEVANS
ncbi:hypothetical protein JCM8547_006340 [Rhodosporidiobolus lusitaniae]